MDELLEETPVVADPGGAPPSSESRMSRQSVTLVAVIPRYGTVPDLYRRGCRMNSAPQAVDQERGSSDRHAWLVVD